MQKVCPVCNETKECEELKVGILKAHYKCEKSHEFETRTIFAEGAPIVLGIIGAVLGIEVASKK